VGQVEARQLNRAGWDGGSAGLNFAPSLLTVAGYFTSNLEMRGEPKSLQDRHQKFCKLTYLLSAASRAGFAQASLALCNISRASVILPNLCLPLFTLHC
jgi:hypothetical protein